MKHVAGSVSKF